MPGQREDGTSDAFDDGRLEAGGPVGRARPRRASPVTPPPESAAQAQRPRRQGPQERRPRQGRGCPPPSCAPACHDTTLVSGALVALDLATDLIDVAEVAEGGLDLLGGLFDLF